MPVKIFHKLGYPVGSPLATLAVFAITTTVESEVVTGQETDRRGSHHDELGSDGGQHGEGPGGWRQEPAAASSRGQSSNSPKKRQE